MQLNCEPQTICTRGTFTGLLQMHLSTVEMKKQGSVKLMVIRHRQDLDQWFLGFHLFLALLCGGAARWPYEWPECGTTLPGRRTLL